ncbi:MAG TPA: hypothetical protein PK373_10845, partial [Sedimentisphaerales bacterium]|nr:hypothetical protein [Sedimentisphaerales bacterium]
VVQAWGQVASETARRVQQTKTLVLIEKIGTIVANPAARFRHREGSREEDTANDLIFAYCF